ncbi:MAG: DUF4962 domain-containing protein [Spirochaetaceae bacterium]|jgi:hypothetical protein|nr:DUF4962 domain-containing protein [Spirochaetaceae bacterium]
MEKTKSRRKLNNKKTVLEITEKTMPAVKENTEYPQTHKHITGSIIADIIAVILCLLGAAAAFFFFLSDLNKSLTKLNEAPIANVYDKTNTSQRRFGDRVVWDILQKSSPVYNGDIIHTSDLSMVTVQYTGTDGNEDGEFILEQNSLIQVFTNKIELANGKIAIKTKANSAKLKLISQGTVIDIDSNSIITANSIEAGGGSIQVLEGKAMITTAEGVRETSAGEALAVSADGKQKNTAQVVLLSPKPGQTIVISDSDSGEQPVSFTWRTLNINQDDLIRFEIAADQHFSRIIQFFDLHNTSDQAMNLPAGNYWWRVYPVNSGEENNDLKYISNNISVVSAAKPKLVQPVDGSTVRYYTENTAVRLQWITEKSGNAASLNFIVEAANNPAMNNPSLYKEVRGENFLVTTDLTPGQWYWQVRAVYPENYGSVIQSASQPASFLLEKSTSGSLPAPTLIQPADNENVFIDIGVTLSWSVEKEAASYNIQIAQNRDFSSPVLERPANSNFYRLMQDSARPLNEGIYYWRAAALNNNGIKSPYSAIRSFTLARTRPPVVLIHPADNWKTTITALPATRFTWKYTIPGGAVRCQFSNTLDFTRINASIAVSGTNAEPPVLSSGTYYWRIAWTGENGTTFFTPPRSFTIGDSARIQLEYPVNNIEVDGLTAARSLVSARWSSAEPVSRSRFILSTKPDPASDSAPLLSISNPAHNVPLPSLQPGVYYWTVQGESQTGTNISPEQPSNFRVGSPPLISAVRLLSPTNNYILNNDRLRSNRNINFTWSASNQGNGYILSIYRSNKNSRAPVFKSHVIKETRFLFTNLALLDNGIFIWSIEPVLTSASGEIKQHGEPNESAFSVNITIPKTESLPDEQTFGF